MHPRLVCGVTLVVLLFVAVASALSTENLVKRANTLDCPIAPTVPADRRTNKNVLSVVSYNAEWLFYDGGSGRSVCPGDGCPWPDQAAATQHYISIASVLTDLDADIVVMQELESCASLNRLLSYMPNNSSYKPYMVKGTDTATGQQVGLITKVDPIMNVIRTSNRVSYPIPGSNCGSTKTGTSTISKHLFTKFIVNDVTIALAGVHYVAFPTNNDRCSQREAQASVLRDFVRSQTNLNTEEVIVLGDMNDYDDVVKDASNSKPTSTVLKIEREITTPTLFNVASLQTDQSKRYSSWYDRNGNCRDDVTNERTSIDHILVSSGLRERITSMKFHHAYDSTCDSTFSDHFPIYVQFQMTAPPSETQAQAQTQLQSDNMTVSQSPTQHQPPPEVEIQTQTQTEMNLFQHSLSPSSSQTFVLPTALVFALFVLASLLSNI